MPITCGPHKDWLFYILYCGDTAMMIDVIKQCMQNIIGMHHNHPDVVDIVSKYAPDAEKDSILQLRMKFLILLEEDEYTRRELVEKKTSVKGHFGAVPLEKANQFYTTLHEQLLPMWVSDESVCLSDFLDHVRMAYLIA